LGISYGSAFFQEAISETFNPASPLAQGLTYVDFDGGFGSSPYTGPGTSNYIISSATDGSLTIPIGQTVQLPSGGRIVAWGDEWITYAYNFEKKALAYVNQDDVFWKNAINWSGVCVPSVSAPCIANPITSNPYTVSATTTTTKSVCLSICGQCAPIITTSDQAAQTVLTNAIDYFGNGAIYPAGIYSVQNMGGCMKYSPSQGWAVNAITGSAGYVLVLNGVDSSQMPGSLGFNVPPNCSPPTDEHSGSNGYGFCPDDAGFLRCSAYNAALPSLTFTTTAPGTIGFRLLDTYYPDNVAGDPNVGGGAPSWGLIATTC